MRLIDKEDIPFATGAILILAIFLYLLYWTSTPGGEAAFKGWSTSSPTNGSIFWIAIIAAWFSRK